MYLVLIGGRLSNFADSNRSPVDVGFVLTVTFFADTFTCVNSQNKIICQCYQHVINNAINTSNNLVSCDMRTQS